MVELKHLLDAYGAQGIELGMVGQELDTAQDQVVAAQGQVTGLEARLARLREGRVASEETLRGILESLIVTRRRDLTRAQQELRRGNYDLAAALITGELNPAAEVPVPSTPLASEPSTVGPSSAPAEPLGARILQLRPRSPEADRAHAYRQYASAATLYDLAHSGAADAMRALGLDPGSVYMLTGTLVRYQRTQRASLFEVADGAEQNLRTLVVPEYLGTPLPRVLNDPDGLRFIQGVFGTEESAEQIGVVLNALSGRPLDRITVWTVDTAKRHAQQHCELTLYALDSFRIDARHRVTDIIRAAS